MCGDGGLVQPARRRHHGAVGDCAGRRRGRIRTDGGRKRSAGTRNDTRQEEGEKIFCRFHASFMPCRFQLAKLKAFARQDNTHFRVYAEPFLACMRGIFSPFSGFRAGGIPKCGELRRCLVRDGARRAGDLRVRNESGEVCRKSREELAKSGGLFLKCCGLFGRAPP